MFVVFRIAKPIGIKKQKYGSSSSRYYFSFFCIFYVWPCKNNA